MATAPHRLSFANSALASSPGLVPAVYCFPGRRESGAFKPTAQKNACIDYFIAMNNNNNNSEVFEDVQLSVLNLY